MSDTDPSRQRRTLTRRLGVLAGAITAMSLAGCTSDDDPSDDGTPTAATPTPTQTPTPTPTSTPTPAEGTPPGTDTPPDDSTPGGDDPTPDGGDPGECSDDTIATLEFERDTLEQEIADFRFEHERELQEYEKISIYRDQMEFGFGDETMSEATDIGLMARDATVIIKQHDAGGVGTGWFVEPDLIFTNSHNVQSGQVYDLQATAIDGTAVDVSIVEYVEDEIPDVALLRTEGYEHDSTLSLGSESALEPEQPLVQTGHPGGIGYWVTSLGYYLSQEEYGMDGGTYNELKTLVPGIEGVSGSPVLTLEGDVVGMTYGGQPMLERDPKDPAPVIPDRVFDSPLGHITTAMHIGSDVMNQFKEEWQ